MGPRTILGTVLTAMAVPLLLTLIGTAARGRPALGPEPAAAGPSCLLRPITMRYQHMTYLRELREQVVRRGDRSALGPEGQLGISGCGNCHVDQAAFCDRCHSAAGVNLDCFLCHGHGTGGNGLGTGPRGPR